MLQYLQQNQNNLTAQQQNVLQQLTNQYRLMQQHQQQVRLQQQQRTQTGAVQSQQQQQQQSGQVVNRPAGQQFIGQQPSSFQQTTPRVPQSGTIAQTGFAVESSGNFPAATGHTLPNAGMPYKSANVGTFQQNQFGTNLGYTQISSTTTNQSDMGTVFSVSVSCSFITNNCCILQMFQTKSFKLCFRKKISQRRLPKIFSNSSEAMDWTLRVKYPTKLVSAHRHRQMLPPIRQQIQTQNHRQLSAKRHRPCQSFQNVISKLNQF